MYAGRSAANCYASASNTLHMLMRLDVFFLSSRQSLLQHSWRQACTPDESRFMQGRFHATCQHASDIALSSHTCSRVDRRDLAPG